MAYILSICILWRRFLEMIPAWVLSKSHDSTTVNAYTYDYDGYLTGFDATGTESDATYTYDADKRRIAKTVDSDTIKYFLDGPNVIADYDGDDVLLATYVTPGLDANLCQTRSGSTYYYMADGLGSIRNVVDANEDTQNIYDYYAFGKELGSWSENITNGYTYTAREYDPESEQYYYRARMYSAVAGVFLARDPAWDSPNLYRYVRNCPTQAVDPMGTSTNGLGVGGSVTAGVWVGVEVLFVWDDKCNYGVLACGMAGVGYPVSGSVYGMYQRTNMSTICDLEGLSFEVGGSVTIGFLLGVGVGVDVLLARDGSYIGFEVQAGPGVGVAEGHACVSACGLVYVNNPGCGKKGCCGETSRLPDKAPPPVVTALESKVSQMNAMFRARGYPAVDQTGPVIRHTEKIPWGQAFR